MKNKKPIYMRSHIAAINIIALIIKRIKENDSSLADDIQRIIIQEKFRFSELGSSARLKAAKEYMSDFNDIKTDEEDFITLSDAMSCCYDTDDEAYYSKQGRLLEHT